MSDIFPRWCNKIPLFILMGIGPVAAAVGLGVWYYGSPEFTDVGYRPKQPVFYSHKLHAGELGLDCRYCHAQVEVSSVASVPPTHVCMNCHRVIANDRDSLALVRDSAASGTPIEWVRVHQVPDYAYFNHNTHINAGVGCASCHGNVAQMEVVTQVKSLSMGWCLECHRNPDPHLRPADEVTNMNWRPPKNQAAFVAQLKQTREINPPVDCSGCHR